MNNNYAESKQKLQTAVANVVRAYRMERNKSISKISAEIMMTKSIWTDLEHGIKDPQLSTLWRVAEALDIPLEELIAKVKEELGKDFTLID